MKEYDFIRWMIELCEDGDIETAISEMKAWVGDEERIYHLSEQIGRNYTLRHWMK